MRVTTTPDTIIGHYKDRHNSTLIQADTLPARKNILRGWLEKGMRVTALGINIMLGFNDGRKFISELRKSGTKGNYAYIVHTTTLKDSRKVYQLKPITPQPNLFSAMEGARYE